MFPGFKILTLSLGCLIHLCRCRWTRTRSSSYNHRSAWLWHCKAWLGSITLPMVSWVFCDLEGRFRGLLFWSSALLYRSLPLYGCHDIVGTGRGQRLGRCVGLPSTLRCIDGHFVHDCRPSRTHMNLHAHYDWHSRHHECTCQEVFSLQCPKKQQTITWPRLLRNARKIQFRHKIHSNKFKSDMSTSTACKGDLSWKKSLRKVSEMLNNY